jgi:membrane protein
MQWVRRHIWPTLSTTLVRWYQDDGGLLSAAMAYYAAFALFPLCLILIAVLSWLSRLSPELHAQRLELVNVIEQNTGPWVGQQVHNVLQNIDTQASIGGPLGAITLLIAAIGIFLQLDAIFDRIWTPTAPRDQSFLAVVHRILVDRLLAFCMLLAVGGLLILVSIANFAAAGLRPYIDRLPAGAYAWQLVQPGIALVSNCLLFATIYKVFPKARVRWREALAGGVLVALVWQAGQLLLARIVIASHYGAYGVVGSFVAIMVWMYYSSAVIFLGAEFVKAICRDCVNPTAERQKPDGVRK